MTGLCRLPSSPVTISLQERIRFAVENDVTTNNDGATENGGAMENDGAIMENDGAMENDSDATMENDSDAIMENDLDATTENDKSDSDVTMENNATVEILKNDVATKNDGATENYGATTTDSENDETEMAQDEETAQEAQEEIANQSNQLEVNSGRRTQQSRRIEAPCHRNGRTLAAQPQWKANKKTVGSSNITAESLIASLAVATFADLSHTSNPRPWIRSIKDAATLSVIRNEGRQDSDLASIVRRCSYYRSKEVGMSFLMMLSFIQLAFTCER